MPTLQTAPRSPHPALCRTGTRRPQPGSPRPATTAKSQLAPRLATPGRTPATPIAVASTRMPDEETTPVTGRLQQSDTAISAADLAPVQALPPEILYQIFLYLPLSSLNSCALVCHSWYASLPPVRMRLPAWLNSLSHSQHPEFLQLADGYSSRTRPWLASQRCPGLPLLDRQHQELLRLQERLQQCQQAPQQVQRLRYQVLRARCLLSGLIRYSLYQHMLQTPQLTLQPARISQPAGQSVSEFTFSRCGRWLASSYSTEATGPAFFRIHALRGTCWKEETLIPPPDKPVASREFSQTTSTLFFSAHGSDLATWHKQMGTENWKRVQLYSIKKDYEIKRIIPMVSGDLIAMCRGVQAPVNRMVLIFRPSPDGQGWEPPMPHFYTTRCIVTPMPCHNLLAIGIAKLPRMSIYYSNQVHIWHRKPVPGGSAVWSCQVSVLRARLIPVASLRFSLDARHLLALLSDGQVLLSTLDSQYQLQEQVRISSCIDPHIDQLHLQAPFHHDSKQFALPRSLRKIQLWHQNQSGHWRAGETLEVPSSPDDSPDEKLLGVAWSSDGRLLAQRTSRQVNIWCRNQTGHWQHQVQRKNHDANAPAPNLMLLHVQGAVCTQAADPLLRLCMHGAAENGQIVTKSDMPFALPLTSSTTDGLSLTAGFSDEPFSLRLGGPPRDTNPQAALQPP